MLLSRSPSSSRVRSSAAASSVPVRIRGVTVQASRDGDRGAPRGEASESGARRTRALGPRGRRRRACGGGPPQGWPPRISARTSGAGRTSGTPRSARRRPRCCLPSMGEATHTASLSCVSASHARARTLPAREGRLARSRSRACLPAPGSRARRRRRTPRRPRGRCGARRVCPNMTGVTRGTAAE